MKETIHASDVIKVLIIILIIVAACFLIGANHETPSDRLAKTLSNIGSQSAENETTRKGVEEGSAAASYEFVMSIYPTDPVARLTHLTEAYMEDGVISDAEYPYLQKVSQQAQQYLDSLPNN